MSPGFFGIMVKLDRRCYLWREFPIAGDDAAQFLVVDPESTPFGPDRIALALYLAQAGLKVNLGIEVEDRVAYVVQERGGIEREDPFEVDSSSDYFRCERRGYRVFPKFPIFPRTAGSRNSVPCRRRLPLE